MLDKLKVEFTRSRPRHSNDNGLAETKNGAVVRKEFGFAHIPQRHAARFNTYCAEYLNPWKAKPNQSQGNLVGDKMKDQK